jgi:glycosyltransferase involved in cell wall biosynthesis
VREQRDRRPASHALKVLLATEGTYPYAAGGVTTWCERLLAGLPDHDFTVLAITPNPHVDDHSPPLPNVRVVPVPLWGTGSLDEYLPRPRLLRRQVLAGGGGPMAEFLPIFDELLSTMLIEVGPPERVAACLVELAGHAGRWELRRSLAHRRTWGLFSDRLRAHPLYRRVGLSDVMSAADRVHRCLLPLTVPVADDIDVFHASAAAFSALPGLRARLERGVPLLLTEHGVYLREQILYMLESGASTLQKMMVANFYRATVAATYHVADRILPVCAFNARWEAFVDPSTSARTTVIPNGVPPDHFRPLDVPDPGPVAVVVGRVHPIKDLETLLAALALVRRAVPGARLEIWGPEPDESYSRLLRARAAALDVPGEPPAVRFCGATDQVVEAMHRGQVVVQSSISEGMPFALLEAMSAGRPVVATAVGGVPELLPPGPCLVAPRDAFGLAAAWTRVLSLPAEERAALGAANRRRVLDHFDLDRMTAAFDAEYRAAPGLVGVGSAS